MIIGNNNYNPNANNFQNKMKAIKNNAKTIRHNGMNNENINKYRDINNQNEMIDKSLAMLQERLNNGLISLDDFQKQCEKLGKLRK